MLTRKTLKYMGKAAEDGYKNEYKVNRGDLNMAEVIISNPDAFDLLVACAKSSGYMGSQGNSIIFPSPDTYLQMASFDAGDDEDYQSKFTLEQMAASAVGYKYWMVVNK